MENESPVSTALEWTSIKVYTLAAICLILGIILGALFHGPAKPATLSAESSQGMSGNLSPHGAGGVPKSPSAALSSDPIFEKAKNDPNNFDLLSQAGNAAMKGGDPKMAADYYGRALKVKDDLDIRTNLANAYFRSGDPDQSLAELAIVLKADPKNDKALYNTGMVKLMAKGDAKGAIASWEAFLKYHPDHAQKNKVQEMIKRVKQAESKTQG